MTMYYSASAGGFYDSSIHGDRIPSDATEESVWLLTYKELLNGQAIGKIITSDDSGNPSLSNPPAPTVLQLWSEYQSKAQVLLDKTSVTMERITEGVVLGSCILTNADVIAFMKYRQDLRAIVKATSGDPAKELPSHPGYPAGT